MSYEHCTKHSRDATNGCPECADEMYGMTFQESVDSGREDIRCGVCGGEVDCGVVTDEGAQRGICFACAVRVWNYLHERGQIR